MRSVQEIGDELFALPPQAFTAARDGHIAEAKRSGERAAAAELTALKRPTVSAWLVNLLALRRPGSIAQLIELGESIRAAQGSVTPMQLRDLSAQRRKVIDRLLAEAQSLVAALGEAAPSKPQLAEVESTLAAAMADEDAARRVRSGRVVKAMSYSGFGAIAAGVVSPTRSPSGPSAPTAADPPVAASDESRRAAATARLVDAQRALTDALATEREAGEAVDRIADGIAGLRERLEAAQLAARAARQSRIAAERDLASAQRRLRSVET